MLVAVIRGLHAVKLLKACRPCWQRERGGNQKTEKKNIIVEKKGGGGAV